MKHSLIVSCLSTESHCSSVNLLISLRLVSSELVACSSSALVACSSSAKVQPGTVILVSLANIFAQDISRQLGRSFIYILKKNRGPSILPWGTPQVNFLTLDNAPLTVHFWDLLRK